MVISPLIDLASDVFFLIGGLFALLLFFGIFVRIGEIVNDFTEILFVLKDIRNKL